MVYDIDHNDNLIIYAAKYHYEEDEHREMFFFLETKFEEICIICCFFLENFVRYDVDSQNKYE